MPRRMSVWPVAIQILTPLGIGIIAVSEAQGPAAARAGGESPFVGLEFSPVSSGAQPCGACAESLVGANLADASPLGGRERHDGTLGN